MYDEKLRLGEKEITDRDLNVFFSDKALQSDVVAGWTDTAVRKLKQCFTRMMFEAGLLEVVQNQEQSSQFTLTIVQRNC